MIGLNMVMINNKHADSGRRCLVGHGPDEGQCLKCYKCKKWISPKNFSKTECLVVEDFERSHIFDVFGPGLTFYVKNGNIFCIDTKQGHAEMDSSSIKMIIKYLQGICEWY